MQGVGSTVSVDRRVRCQRSVLVVSHARHTDGMVHAATGRERVPGRIGAAALTDGHGMVDLGIRTNGTLNTASDQRSREENRQTSGGRVVQSNEDVVSVPWLSHLHTTRGERRQREILDQSARRDPKEHRLPTPLCQDHRVV